MNLLDVYDTGDRQLIKAAADNLKNAVIKSARDIRNKYIAPPMTTEFAIMFLPFEGLYAEVLRLGLVDVLQRDYRVNIAGPTTMSAMLNSFQMGFRSIALQKQSGQVWDTLAKVRSEFDKFGDVLGKDPEPYGADTEGSGDARGSEDQRDTAGAEGRVFIGRDRRTIGSVSDIIGF